MELWKEKWDVVSEEEEESEDPFLSVSVAI
jgi:hypothetical protein